MVMEERDEVVSGHGQDRIWIRAEMQHLLQQFARHGRATEGFFLLVFQQEIRKDAFHTYESLIPERAELYLTPFKQPGEFLNLECKRVRQPS
jgi:hypothetical protein